MERTSPFRRTPRPAGPRRRTAAGFTLIESGIVLAVIAIVAGIAAPSLRELTEGRRLQGAASTLATDLRFVRAEAAARGAPLRFDLRATSAGSCYVIHTGAAGACDCAAGPGATRCTAGAVPIRTARFDLADSVRVQANVGSMVFDPARGTTTPTGTFEVVGRSGRSIRQVVNILGRVRTCSPDRVAGVRPC